MKIFRWKALVPLALFALVVVLGWTLYVDRLIRLGIEAGGTAAVGARVDLRSARLRLFHGDLVLRGLAVTDPGAPMKNLFESDQIVLDLNVRALLEKKAVADTVAVRGLRFGTDRKTSGALPARTKSEGAATHRGVEDWAEALPLPSLDFEGLGKGLEAIRAVSPESLRTLAQAHAVAASADSAKAALERKIVQADPRPVIDSARALASRLQGADIRRLGIGGARDAAASIRSTLTAVRGARDRVTALKAEVTKGVDSVRSGIAALDRARAEDYAYARRLVKVPSLDPKDISAALVGRAALQRLVPGLFLLQSAKQRIPPGLMPQRSSGPKRTRMAGTTFHFPKARHYPSLLVEFAEGSFALAGRTAMAGDYLARLTSLTTEPAVWGRPLTFLAQRTGAVVGPTGIHVGGALDHTGAIPHDSIKADLDGVGLPGFDLGAVAARVDLGTGVMRVGLVRTGDEVNGSWMIRTDSAGWTRLPDTAAVGDSNAIGSRAWLDALVWRAVSSLRQVEVSAAISGRLASPRFDVSSNIGTAVAGALRQAVAAEVSRVEAQVRAKVDSLVGQQVAAARAKLAALDTGPLKSLTDDQAQLDAVQAQLEQRLKGLVPGIPGLRP
jgi:uncharacterized protein (TIGR03545 family)